MNAPAQSSLSAAALPAAPALGRRLDELVLQPLKRAFVGKDEIIDLLGVCLAAGENCFLLGPPGTAKSALVHGLARRLDARGFDYLLTRFTEPSELFGPFDLRRLREGDLVTNTEGMLPEAELVFLDELLNANSAILNSLLMVLNEKVFRRGREQRALPVLMVVGASNRLPEDEALQALFDRFLVRVRSGNVGDEQLPAVLAAGWMLEQAAPVAPKMSAGDIRALQAQLRGVDLAPVAAGYLDVIRRMRRAGLAVSDRRAVRLQRLVAASALLCGRSVAQTSDLWVLRYTWDTEEQAEVLTALVDAAISQAAQAPQSHPQAAGAASPDAAALARELAAIGDALAAIPAGGADADAERARLRDRLGLVAGRVQWVADVAARGHLDGETARLWTGLGGDPP